MADRGRVPGWWRRNRWGLLALPLVAGLAVAGNGIRADDYWWNRDLRQATSGTQGEFVRYQQDYFDALGETSRTLEVRLDGVAEVTSIPASYGDPQPVPDGFRALRVDLSFRADPDQSVYGCQLGLLGRNGDRYEFRDRLADVAQDEVFPCHPFAAPGPRPPVFEGDQRGVLAGEERPEAWQMHPIVLVPEDAEVTHVLMWWEKPGHLKLRIRD